MPSRLFDDPQADARMRAIIPRLALLGCLVYTVVGVATNGFGGNYRDLAVLVGIALAGTVTIDRLHVTERAPSWLLFAILMSYVVLVAAPITGGHGPGAPYEMVLDEIFLLLPVFFAAIFFEGRLRYAAAVIVAALQFGIESAYGHGAVVLSVGRLLAYLVASRLAAEVAGVLREALARNDALHEVVAAASSDPGGAVLAGGGLAGALRLLGWEVGAVVVREGTEVRIAESRGVDRGALTADVAAPQSPYGALVRSVLSSGERQETVAGPALPAGLWVLAGLPIRYRDEVIGVLVAGSSAASRLGADDVFQMSRIADQLGLALGAVQAYRAEVRVAEELRELNNRKDEFLANVSHELRTPLTSIGLACFLLSTAWESLDPAKVRETIEDLEERAAALTTLVESLLDQAVADAGVLRLALAPIDWQPALTRWVHMAEQVTGREVALSMPAEPVQSLGDPAKLERVVANLLGNAAKFSPPGSPILARLSDDDQWVRLAVTDAGIGIPAEELPRIFDRFYQADGSPTRSVGGVGIGLSLVQHFVSAHGGSVSVRSRPGAGSTFTVRLPRVPAPADVATG